MAKIDISVDTENKTIEVKVGSQTIENVCDVYLSSDKYGYFNAEICQTGEVEGMKQRTYLTASQKDRDWKEKPNATAEEIAKAFGYRLEN